MEAALTAIGRGKAWWKSKQLWVFGIALVAGAMQKKYGWAIDAEMQVTALAVIGIVLRLITHEPIDWGNGKDSWASGEDDEE